MLQTWTDNDIELYFKSCEDGVQDALLRQKRPDVPDNPEALSRVNTPTMNMYIQELMAEEMDDRAIIRRAFSLSVA